MYLHNKNRDTIKEYIMSNKIIEIITEPDKIRVGSTFLLKVKAISYLTYNEVKTKTYSYMKNYT